jgi:outer membrane protein assembly factor BamB
MNMKKWLLVGVLGLFILGVAAVAYKMYRRPVARSKNMRVAERSLYTATGTAPGATTFAAAEDWPRWRGPRGDGISRETNLAEKWPEDGPPRLWSAEVGLGYSSPVAVAGRIYLFTTAEGNDTLTCFDAASGKILWNISDVPGWIRSYEGTRATPTIEGNRIYTLGGMGELVCRDVANGNVVWRVNILKDKGSKPLQWGTASSPLIAGNLVFVQGGESGPVAYAVDKTSGSIAWKSGHAGPAGYAALMLIDVSGTPQLICFAGDALLAMDPATGGTIWKEAWPTQYGVNGTTPVYRDGHLFVSSAYDKGCMMLRVEPKGPKKLWENRNVESRFQGMVLDGDALYANSEGVVKCLSWPDGKVLWQSSEPGLNKGGSMVRIPGDRMILMSERGELTLARVTPEKIEIISQAKVFDQGSETWSTPLIYGGRLYAKAETEFVCFDVSAGRASSQSSPTADTK